MLDLFSFAAGRSLTSVNDPGVESTALPAAFRPVANPCKHCGHPAMPPMDTRSYKPKICAWCAADIVNRCIDGESTVYIADHYGTSKGSIVSTFSRYKPDGASHPGGRAFGPRRPKPAPVKPIKYDLYGPPINPRWIERNCCKAIDGHVGEDWSYCQAPVQAGSSYCPTHHAINHRELEPKAKRPVYKHRKLSAREAVQAYA